VIPSKSRRHVAGIERRRFHRIGGSIFPSRRARHRLLTIFLDARSRRSASSHPSTKEKRPDVIEVAISAGPNVGKSTLLERMVGEERSSSRHSRAPP